MVTPLKNLIQVIVLINQTILLPNKGRNPTLKEI